MDRAGKRIAHVRAELHDADGRLLCTGASTHAVVAHEFWRRDPPPAS